MENLTSETQETLNQLLVTCEKVGTALDFKLDTDDFILVAVIYGNKGRPPQPGDPIWEKYQKASLRFSFKDLDAIGQAGRGELKIKLQQEIEKAFDKRRLELPDSIKSFINSTSPSNVLQHEYEHCLPLPDQIKRQTRLDVVFTTEGLESDKPVVDGIYWYDLKNADSRTQALSASNPASLSKNDINDAVRYAKKTGDEEFLKLIEDRIADRFKH